MATRDCKVRDGEHRAIAALAVIMEGETVGKKRHYPRGESESSHTLS